MEAIATIPAQEYYDLKKVFEAMKKRKILRLGGDYYSNKIIYSVPENEKVILDLNKEIEFLKEANTLLHEQIRVSKLEQCCIKKKWYQR